MSYFVHFQNFLTVFKRYFWMGFYLRKTFRYNHNKVLFAHGVIYHDQHVILEKHPLFMLVKASNCLDLAIFEAFSCFIHHNLLHNFKNLEHYYCKTQTWMEKINKSNYSFKTSSMAYHQLSINMLHTLFIALG